MMNIHLKNQSRLSQTRNRRGVSLLWMLILFPALMILLCLIVEIGNIWLARLELEHALEATALSAVQEWAENGGGDTMPARTIGNDFAMANAVRDISVDLTDYDANLNYNAANTNDNDVCTDIDNMPMFDPTGILVFGAITQIEDAMNPNDPQVIFDAGVEPSCTLGGDVLVDATAQGNVGGDDAWGISFRADTDPMVNNNLRIVKIEIDVDPTNAGEARFNFINNLPVVSDNLPDAIISDGGLKVQPDNYGWANTPPDPPGTDPQVVLPSNQISFSYIGLNPTVLTINFGPDDPDPMLDIDDGFAPGDRFRFGAEVEKKQGMGGMFSQASADEIGELNTQIRIYFENNGVPVAQPAIGTMIDNGLNPIDKMNACFFDAAPVIDPVGGEHWLVHGRRIMDLPCPATAAASNNGQSFVELSGTSDPRNFAVRAQTMREVPSICKILCGVPLGPWTISAKSTAYFDCETLDPKLIHIDEFICP